MSDTGDTGSVNGLSVPPQNRKPAGKNQYTHCPPRNDATVSKLLRDYDRRGVSSRRILSELLRDEHGIFMSETTIARRRKVLGLRGSGATTKALSETSKRQLVLDQMAKDPNRVHGPRSIKRAILLDTGIHLTRNYIHQEMRVQDPEGFELREPSRKREGSTPISPPE